MQRRNLVPSLLRMPVRGFAAQTSESVIDDIVSFVRQASQVRCNGDDLLSPKGFVLDALKCQLKP